MYGGHSARALGPSNFSQPLLSIFQVQTSHRMDPQICDKLPEQGKENQITITFR